MSEPRPIEKTRDALGRSVQTNAEYVRARVKVDANGCWIWQRFISRAGYGETAKWRGRIAHRVSYEAFVGPIPTGLELDHLCRVRACVNPEHLEPVQRRENQRRGRGFVAVNSAKTHCKRGHEFTPENTRIRIRPTYTARGCRACERIRQATKKEAAALGGPLKDQPAAKEQQR